MPDESDLSKVIRESPETQVAVSSSTPPRASKVKKAVSRQQWSAIFSKPAKIQPEAKQEEESSHQNCELVPISHDVAANPSDSPPPHPVNGSSPVIKSTKRKHINPYNPFNSFVVTLNPPKGTVFPLEPISNVLDASKALQPEVSSDANSTLASRSSLSTIRENPHMARESVTPASKSSVASFFAKRPTNVGYRANATRPRLATKPFKPTEAPFQIVHIRPEQSWTPRSVTKRPRKKDGKRKSMDLWDLFPRGSSLKSQVQSRTFFSPPAENIHTPTRRLIEGSQLQAIAIRAQSMSSVPQTNKLCESVSEPDAFDLGLFETKMWSEKYAPTKPVHHFSPQSAQTICAWLQAQQTRINKQSAVPKVKRAKRKTALSDFVVDDESESDDESAILIISGPAGSGKTSAVYASAQDLDVFVFEVNASVKRTGKELSGMLDGIGRNHAVHSAKNVVILVDDADVVYENEAGSFWPTITKFASTSRRPVVITCVDPSLIALPPSQRHEMVFMRPPNLVTVTDLAWIIALNEGHLIDKCRLSDLVAQLNGDMRRILATLQFWCQFGIGGLPSGADWVPKLSEFSKRRKKLVNSAESAARTTRVVNIMMSDSETESESEDRDDIVLERPRVISDGTWFELPNEQPRDGEYSPKDEPKSVYIEKLTASLDEVETRSEDSVWVNTALPVTHWKSPVLVPPHNSNAKTVKSAVDPYNFYSYSTRFRSLCLDIAPYMRHMVVSDAQRQLAKNSAVANLSDREQRTAMRSMKYSGVDLRNYLDLSFEYMTSILNTGFKTTNHQPMRQHQQTNVTAVAPSMSPNEHDDIQS